MKWDKPQGSTQQTKDGRYLIMQANSQHWVVYNLGSKPTEIGVRSSDVDARQACEDYELAHRRSA